MKRMICDSMLVLGALAFVVVVGAAIEGTMPLAAALGLLAVLASGMRGIVRLEQPRAVCRVRRGRGRYRRPAPRPRKAEALRAA